MRFQLFPLVISLALAVGLARAEDVRTGSFTDSLARFLNSDVRRADQRLVSLSGELDQLPSLAWRPHSPRHGFHSAPSFLQNEPQWIQIDLLNIYPIDMIALVPADVISPTAPGTAHAFPLRFKIELASQEDLSDAVVIVDQTKEDFPNPGRFPLLSEQPGREAQYVRVTCTKLWPTRDGDYTWALGEIMVMSGIHNVAIFKPRAASAGSLELAPHWKLAGINDGQTSLGIPVTARESHTNGYRSSNTKRPSKAKWVTVDLEKEYRIDEVRLIPAWPREVTDAVGMGFPHSLKVLLSNDRQFKKNVSQLNSSAIPNHPWNNPYTVRVTGKKKRGRYLRVESLRLEGRGGNYFLALAEVQAFSVNKNVALGKPVLASDASLAGAGPSRWAPEYLVDGFSSRYELTDWASYLHALGDRKNIERERAELVQSRDFKVRRMADAAMITGSGVAGVALLTLVGVMVRGRKVRQQDREHIREQIACDLHDELGSNLGSISLLGELGSRLHGLPDEVRKDFHRFTGRRSAQRRRCATSSG
jgi:hypothetical protein